jgi:penicillin-binding protein 1A
VASVAGYTSNAGISVTRRLRFAGAGRGVVLAAALLAVLFLVLTVRLVHYIYLDRSGLPDLERFIRFELPTIGAVYDAHGTVLVEPAREYRRIVSYDEVPPVLRDAILAAEDRNFFTHGGIEYRALPRVAYKAMVHSVIAWWNGAGFRLRFPQGGSTLT